MSLINLPEGVSEICKSALFKMSLRCCIRRLKDASEMHPCRLGSHWMCFNNARVREMYRNQIKSNQIKSITHFLYKSKLNINNLAKIGKKRRTSCISRLGRSKTKRLATMIYVSFKHLLTKEWKSSVVM